MCVIVSDTIIKPLESKATRTLGPGLILMQMNVHIGKIKAFRGLYNIRQIKKFLTVQPKKTLVHAFESSHLDNCNALFLVYLNTNLIVYRKFRMPQQE